MTTTTNPAEDNMQPPTTTSLASLIEELAKVGNLQRDLGKQRSWAESEIDEVESHIEDLQVAVDGLREMLDDSEEELGAIVEELEELAGRVTLLVEGEYGECPVEAATSALSDLRYGR